MAKKKAESPSFSHTSGAAAAAAIRSKKISRRREGGGGGGGENKTLAREYCGARDDLGVEGRELRNETGMPDLASWPLLLRDRARGFTCALYERDKLARSCADGRKGNRWFFIRPYTRYAPRLLNHALLILYITAFPGREICPPSPRGPYNWHFIVFVEARARSRPDYYAIPLPIIVVLEQPG